MRHGDELEVLPNGIRAYQKAVEPLGIVHDSRCWGRWVRAQRLDESDRRLPHLAISPIHPNYWASVFHLELKLLDEPGALEAATEVLRELGVNILFSDGAQSGYRQATYTAICELPAVRQQTNGILGETRFHASRFFHRGESVVSPPQPSLEERKFQEIGLTLLVALAELQAQIRIRESAVFEQWRKNPSSPRPFLHSRAVETGPQPWYVPGQAIDDLAGLVTRGLDIPMWDSRSGEESAALAATFERLREVLSTRCHSREDGRRLLTQEAGEVRKHGGDPDSFVRYYLRSLWRSHWVEPVSVRALLTLAYQRVWSGEKEIEFRYDARQNLLRFEGESSRRRFFDVVGRGQRQDGQPDLAIASVHKHDRFIRLRVLKKNVAERLVTATVTYRTLNADKPVPQPLTKGLLHTIARVLTESRVNLLRVSSQASEFDPHVENGSIRMVGSLPKVEGDERERRTVLESRVRSADDALERSLRQFEAAVPEPGCTIESSVRPFARRKLFLSMPENANRREEIVTEVEIAAAEEGFQVMQARTDSGDVTDNVVATVRECDAMLQVFVPPDPDSKEGEKQPDFQWLWTEYGFAIMADLPVLRLADDTLEPLPAVEPRFRIHRDRPIIRFSTYKDLTKSLRPEVQQFLRGLTAVPQQD